MNNGMKQTEIGEIPVEWEVSRLGDLVTLQKGKKVEPSIEWSNNLMPVIGASSFGGKYETFTHSENGVHCVESDILMLWDGERSGLCSTGHYGILGSTVAKLTPKQGINSKYLFYNLQKEFKWIQRNRTGSGIPHVPSGLPKMLFIALPPLLEQQKIAEILSTVDEKIAVIDEQLAKTTELKAGLMQRLLTKGIRHTEFKDSPLGAIPKGWEASLLDEVTKRGSGHTPSKSFPEYYGGGIKWISLADSNRLDKGWIKDTKYNISSLGIRNSSAVLHPKGTVLLSRDAGVGKSAVMFEDMAVSQHFITWTCGEKINNWFLYYYLQSKKPYFERVAAGSTIKTIGLPLFKKFRIPVPPRSEQDQIANILTTVDDKTQVLHDKKAHYQTLKRGLMQQLLTGKLRVRVAQDAVAA